MLRVFILIVVGALLQSIYWVTDIFAIGILGHIAFLSGLIIFPTMIPSTKKKDRKKDGGIEDNLRQGNSSIVPETEGDSN